MWVKINKDHDLWTAPRRMVSFKEGPARLVKKDIGDALVAAGVAEEVPAPNAQEAKALKAKSNESKED